MGTPKVIGASPVRRLLPYDTREYVPQFLAILYIGKNLKTFGFKEETPNTLVHTELVKVPSPVQFNQIEEITGVSAKDIKKHNPHLLKNTTPPGSQYYLLWVEPHHRQSFVQNISHLSKHRLKGLKAHLFMSAYRGKPLFHRVKRGENLSRIARRYALSVRRFKEA